MINMSTVNAAVKTLLDAGLSADYTILRAPYTNMNPDKTPWIGIYRGPARYLPGSLGSTATGKKWKAGNTVRLQVQATSGKSGQQAEERLEEYIGEIMDILLANPTLGGTVGTIISYDLEYSFNDEASESMYYHMATIDINVESRT